MSEWLNSFLASLDKETAAVLATGAAAFIVALVAGLRGIQRGKPTAAAVSGAAEAITKMSCGAPEISILVREILRMMKEEQIRQAQMKVGQAEIKADIERMGEKITRIEDRTNHR